MILRPRQKIFVERSVAALRNHGNTLGVAPTGAGKTVMLSAVTGALLGDGGKACILAHRDELTEQNESKFRRVNPGISTSVVDADCKSWSGQSVFAMVQTLCRESNLRTMPPLDLLVIDEAHHVAADSYLNIIRHARGLNPDVKIYGVTATPNRGDKKGLRQIFSNVADQISIKELIQSGHLVRPRTYVIDVGTQAELRKVRKTADDFDMAAVEKIMNQAPVNAAVVKHWQEKAGDRQTVVFCSTVAHAREVCNAFAQAGVSAALVTGDTPSAERRQTLEAYEAGDIQLLVNVAVLTEGWDCPPTSCIVLLRPSSYKSTMIQMIGRGLRTVDPEQYPGVIKTDCVILDFGTSSLLHGSLEQGINLVGKEKRESAEALTLTCPECGAEMPGDAEECLICGFRWPEPEEEEQESSDPSPLVDFTLTEIDLLARSSFKWADLFGDGESLIAQGFSAWAGVFHLNGHWHALGSDESKQVHLLSIGEKSVCLAAADDWLNTHETEDTAHKTKRWLSLAPTEKQLNLLPPEYRGDFWLTRYQASTLLTFQFNRNAIRRLIFSAAKEPEVA